MIDIHSHIVWGLDDGPATPEDSLAMLRIAAEEGVDEIVATPHSTARCEFHPLLLRERARELADRSGGRPVIHCGCEFHLDSDTIGLLLDSPRTYTINAGPYLLLELPSLHIGKHTESILRQLLDTGIVPVVAHPERNPVLLGHLDRLESWIELGCLSQITAASLTGGFGGGARSAALRLLDRGLVHVVATDAHDARHRPPVFAESHRVVCRRAGEEGAELLFTGNPRAIVQGSPLTGGKLLLADPPKRRWWPFG